MTSSNFEACLAIVLVYEGGKVNDPRDPGGRTNEGVTQRVYDASRKAAGLGGKSVYDMSAAERDAIYQSGYWDKIGGDSLPLGVDLAVFDPAVNSGPARALSWLKVARAKAADDLGTIEAICAARLSFLHALTTWSAFGKGWGARVASVEAKATRMAAGSSPAASATIQAKATAAAKRAKAAKTNAHASAGGAVTAPAAAHAAGGHHLVAITLAIVGLVVVAVLAFTAWRQSQRSVALTAEAAK